MVIDKSNGKEWHYLVAVCKNVPCHYYFATYDDAETFCNEERKKGNKVSLYDLDYWKGI